MTEETARWLIGVVVVPGLAWATAVIWLLRDIKKGTDKLLEMHENPDKYGFGSNHMTDVLEHLNITMGSMVHYLRWIAEQSTGKPPPPPPPKT